MTFEQSILTDEALRTALFAFADARYYSEGEAKRVEALARELERVSQEIDASKQGKCCGNCKSYNNGWCDNDRAIGAAIGYGTPMLPTDDCEKWERKE